MQARKAKRQKELENDPKAAAAVAASTIPEETDDEKDPIDDDLEITQEVTRL